MDKSDNKDLTVCQNSLLIKHLRVEFSVFFFLLFPSFLIKRPSLHNCMEEKGLNILDYR